MATHTRRYDPAVDLKADAPIPTYTDRELARALRDRAGKIASSDANSAAWLDVAAARIDTGV